MGKVEMKIKPWKNYSAFRTVSTKRYVGTRTNKTKHGVGVKKERRDVEAWWRDMQ